MLFSNLKKKNIIFKNVETLIFKYFKTLDKKTNRQIF